MEDWFTADWGDNKLDLGHLKHRELAGLQIMGMGTDGTYRISTSWSMGGLAVRIRQDDYRPFLLFLYSLLCYAADSGNRYAPEDAYIPGRGFPGEASPYGWSAVVNSMLQPSLGLRWLLCYEDKQSRSLPFAKGRSKALVCKWRAHRRQALPDTLGGIAWSTESSANQWRVQVEFQRDFEGDLAIHIHRPDGKPLTSSSVGLSRRIEF